MRVGFLVDAGTDVGWGHFMRCQALAVEFEGRGSQVEFWVNGSDIGFPEQGFRGTGEPTGGTGRLTGLFSRNDVVVLDFFEPSRVHFGESGPCLVVCLWDEAGEPGCSCDILVDPNLSAVGRCPSPAGVMVLRGADYVILRPQFDRLEPRCVREEARELLVAFGGTPRPDLMLAVQEVLSRAAAPVCQSLTVVLGAAKASGVCLDGAASSVQCRLLAGVTDMRAVMARADFAFLAAGTLMYEACATALPSLVVSLNEGQAREARAFANQGAVRYLGGLDQVSEMRLYQGLLEIGSRGVREDLARRAHQVLDGGGRGRVVDAIAAAWAQRRARGVSYSRS